MQVDSIFIFLLHLHGIFANQLAKTPPMGWNSWNYFHDNINESVFSDTAHAMVQSGLQKAGYLYINSDSGWWQLDDTKTIVRNSSGFMTYDPKKFPTGLPKMIESLHSMGFKYGHYTDAGWMACDGSKDMSEGHEKQDVALFAEWRIDYLKVDNCHVKEQNSIHTVSDRWTTLLEQSGRDIVYSNCHNGCVTDKTFPRYQTDKWEPWCMTECNLWRTSHDIKPTWSSMLFNIDTLKNMGQHAGPGHWNDPDMLEIGNGEFQDDGTQASLDRSRTHFGLWCITSSPLLIGTDLSKASKRTTDILSNKYAIGVNQDYDPGIKNGGDVLEAFNVSTKISNSSLVEAWFKPMSRMLFNDTAGALLLVNRDTKSHNVSFNYQYLPLRNKHTGFYACDTFNVWTNGYEVDAFQIVENMKPQSSIFVLLFRCTECVGRKC